MNVFLLTLLSLITINFLYLKKSSDKTCENFFFKYVELIVTRLKFFLH